MDGERRHDGVERTFTGKGIVEVVAKNQPDILEPVLKNMASAVGQCSPEMILGLLAHQGESEARPWTEEREQSRGERYLAVDKGRAKVMRETLIKETLPDRSARKHGGLRRDGLPARLRGDELRGARCYRAGIGQDFDLHGAVVATWRQSCVTTGLSQPPGGSRRWASAGPHVPGSYS